MDKLDFLIKYLLSERGENISIPESKRDKFRLYRSLVNVRPAAPASDEYYEAENELLKELTAEKGITDAADLTPPRAAYLPMARRYYHAEMRCDSQCCKFWNDRLLLSLPQLY